MSLISVIERHIGPPKQDGGSELVYVFTRIDRFGHLIELYLLRALFPNFDRYYIFTPSPEKRPIANRAAFDFFCSGMEWVPVDDPEIDKFSQQNSYGNSQYQIFSEGSRTYVLINEVILMRMMCGLIAGGASLLPKRQLSEIEIEKGREVSRSLGIADDQKVVTLHIRENNKQRQFDRLVRLRNANTENYSLAIHYLIDQGFVVVRIGDKTMAPLGISHERLIDLPFHPKRNEHADLYFIWRSKFYLGTGAGPSVFPFIFGVPVLLVNLFEPSIFNGPRDRLMYKTYYVKELGRRLRYREMVNSNYIDLYFDEDFERAGIVLEENSPADLLSGVKEMIEFLDQGFGPYMEIVKKFRGIDWIAHCSRMTKPIPWPFFQPFVAGVLPCFEYFANHPELIEDMDIEFPLVKFSKIAKAERPDNQHVVPTANWPKPKMRRWLHKFPEHLFDPLMTVEGWHQDGWVAICSTITLPGGAADVLIICCTIPYVLDPAFRTTLRIDIGVSMLFKETFSPGDHEIRVNIPSTVDIRTIKLLFSAGQTLPVPDGREVGTLIHSIGLDSGRPS